MDRIQQSISMIDAVTKSMDNNKKRFNTKEFLRDREEDQDLREPRNKKNVFSGCHNRPERDSDFL